MNWLLALLFLAAAAFHVEIQGEYLFIMNDSPRSITCYVHYNDGEVASVFIRDGEASRGLWRHGITNLECY